MENIMKDVYADKAYEAMKAIKRDEKGNPFTLDDTIRSMILKHPDIFQYRDDSLNTLYCVLGTGIEWIDGRLGDKSPNNYINLPPSADDYGCWSNKFGMDDSLKQMCGDDTELYKKVKDVLDKKDVMEKIKIYETIDNIDERVKTYRSPHCKDWYPISWYACRLCAPLDAQEDFLIGAMETANLIINSKIEPGHERWVQHQSNKKHAEEVLTVLKLRVIDNEK